MKRLSHLKKHLSTGAFLVLVVLLYLFNQNIFQEKTLENLYDNKVSGQMIELKATVNKILSDDNIGSRHQRILLKRNSLTLLLAHNIDLSERVPVKVGDQLTVFGQYEWNEKGGVIHWTHTDPNNQHAAGWISHKNIKYGSLLN